MTDKPVKADDFEVSEVADDYVVYHSARERVHYLNHTAALVLEYCTGENEASEIVRIVQRAYDLPAPPEREIGDCLAHLREGELIC